MANFSNSKLNGTPNTLLHENNSFCPNNNVVQPLLTGNILNLIICLMQYYEKISDKISNSK